jgi:hypothetical protein
MQPIWQRVSVQRAIVTVTQEAIRVCGGRAFLRRYPLERSARDARAATLMCPWTKEIATQQAWEAALGLGGAAGRCRRGVTVLSSVVSKTAQRA